MNDRIADRYLTIGLNRNDPQYRLGVAQLKEWHERCRAKRLGIKRTPRTVTIWRIMKEDA